MLSVYQRYGWTDGRLTIAIPRQHYVHRAVKSIELDKESGKEAKACAALVHLLYDESTSTIE